MPRAFEEDQNDYNDLVKAPMKQWNTCDGNYKFIKT